MIEPLADRIRSSFDRQGLMATLGARLTRVEEGCVEIEAPLSAAVSQQQGMAHAGLTFALGDSAAGYTALTVMPEGVEVVTSEMSVHLLAPGRGQSLVARGRIIRPGRRLIVAAADVWARDGKTEVLIATLTGTLVPVKA
jgi:uncharacterized protein (TIGR00369 family)